MVEIVKFIKATHAYNTFENPIAAPYIRKSFFCDEEKVATVRIACCGFYRLFWNGQELTKGLLAPYISNPHDYVYYDEYAVRLNRGENVIGMILGNGFQNCPSGYIWEFDKADFRSAPLVAVTVLQKKEDREEVILCSDGGFKTAPGPILSDEFRFGETYDANYEIDGWCDVGFDDTAWQYVIEVSAPDGQLKLCEAEPIVSAEEIRPIRILEDADGYIYDFGQCNAGLCRLHVINGEKGQCITLQHADLILDGTIFLDNMWFPRGVWERDREIVHKDTYICKGTGDETYMPSFTYHGFRYVKVCGIKKEQATEDLLTYVVMHSDLQTRGGFVCSDPVVNELQTITRRSDISNFYYFPTDCPHREKNGWTADAALSCEQMLLNFTPESSYREWLRNICKAQNDAGALPGIVPTGGWGFEWGNGPAWDCVLAVLPYYVYIYRGQTDMITESADAMRRYLEYLSTRQDDNGLLAIGLGDWCHVGGIEPKAPLIVTDSIVAMDIAEKMAFMFNVIGRSADREYAMQFARDMKKAIRSNLIDLDSLVAKGNCQTSQAMCLYYNIYTDEEKPAAFTRLLSLIEAADGHMDLGVLGGRIIFYVLSEFGYSDLALHMITRPDYPSYGNWLARGATTLWENFEENRVDSTNHHFWGFISGWFITNLAGIRFNPHGNNLLQVTIQPEFVSKLDFAEGYYTAPAGKILSRWERQEDGILLTVEIPEAVCAEAVLPQDYHFEDGSSSQIIQSGAYRICKCR